MIHIDVMDGHFVPVITFGPKMVADITDLIHDRGGFADVHLMIEQPERHLDQFDPQAPTTSPSTSRPARTFTARFPRSRSWAAAPA